MKKVYKIFCVAILICIFAFTLIPSIAAKSEAAPKTINIGYMATLTGFASEVLGISLQGAELARDIINDRGGITINGEKYLIKLIVEDTKGSPDGSLAAANKLVYGKKLKFVAGMFPTHFIKAAMSVTEPAGVIYNRCYSCATKDEFGPHTPYSFVSNVSTGDLYKSIFMYLTKNYPDVKTITYILVDDGQIRDNDRIVRKIAKEFGLTIKGDIIGWSPATVDWSAVVTRAIKRNADAIMHGNGGAMANGSIMKIAREMGYTGLIFGCNADGATDIRMVAGKSASTNYFTHGVSESMPDMYPITKEISKRAMARYKRLTGFHLYGFNSIYTMVEAIKAAQSLDPKKVKETWENMDTIETGYGPGRMGGKTLYGLKHTVYHRQPIQVLDQGEIKFGAWIELEELYIP